MPDAHTLARYAVFAVFALAALAALGSWLVRTRRLSPLSPLGRGLRALTDPVVKPVERRLVRMGGNPVHAGWWLVVVVAIGGVIFLSVLDWLVSLVGGVQWAVASGGPRAVLAMAVRLAYQVLLIALVARVVASWLGWFRYARWMRPAYWLTDWLVEPIRKIMPPVAMFDLSPVVAWIVLVLLKGLLLSMLAAA
jgi:YggT family protein